MVASDVGGGELAAAPVADPRGFLREQYPHVFPVRRRPAGRPRGVNQGDRAERAAGPARPRLSAAGPRLAAGDSGAATGDAATSDRIGLPPRMPAWAVILRGRVASSASYCAVVRSLLSVSGGSWPQWDGRRRVLRRHGVDGAAHLRTGAAPAGGIDAAERLGQGAIWRPAPARMAATRWPSWRALSMHGVRPRDPGHPGRSRLIAHVASSWPTCRTS